MIPEDRQNKPSKKDIIRLENTHINLKLLTLVLSCFHFKYSNEGSRRDKEFCVIVPIMIIGNMIGGESIDNIMATVVKHRAILSSIF